MCTYTAHSITVSFGLEGGDELGLSSPGKLYNLALGVSSARASSYILSSSFLNFLAVWGRLSFNLSELLVPYSDSLAFSRCTYVGVKSSFSIVKGSISRWTARTLS